MKCKKCGSININIQAVSVVKNKKHGFVYWFLGGWFLDLMMWVCFFLPWLIIKIFKPKKVTTKVRSQAVCQNCGNTWRI